MTTMGKIGKNYAMSLGWHIIDIEIHNGENWMPYPKYGVCNIKSSKQYKVKHAKEILEIAAETAPLRALIDGEVLAQTDEWREIPLEQWRALVPPGNHD